MYQAAFEPQTAAYSAHTNQIRVLKRCFLWLVLTVLLGLHPGLAQEPVTFECLGVVLTQTSLHLSMVTASKGRAGNKGFLLGFDEWVKCKRYTVSLLCMCWVLCFSVAVLNSYQQDFWIQRENFTSLVGNFFFNVRKAETHLYFCNKDKNMLGKMEKWGNLSIKDFKWNTPPCLPFSAMNSFSYWIQPSV